MTPLLFLRQLALMSPGVELYLPQCVLAFKHLHVGYHLLPVCSSTASSVQGHPSHNRFLFVLSTFAQGSSIRHTFCTVKLQQFLQQRRWRAERRYLLYNSSSFHSLLINSSRCSSRNGNL